MKRRTKKEISKNDLEKFIKEVTSYRQLGLKFNITHQKAKKLVEKYEIDISHFSFHKNYINQIFNWLTILSIEIEKQGKRYKTKAICICKCGNKCKKRLDSVIYGQIKTCSNKCTNKLMNYQLVKGKNNPTYKGYEDLPLDHFNNIKKSAKKRNIEFNLNIEYLWKLFLNQNGKCALTGVNLNFGPRGGKLANASLDRKNSDIGYVEGNVQWTHKVANIMKRTLSQQEFFETAYLANKVYANLYDDYCI